MLKLSLNSKKRTEKIKTTVGQFAFYRIYQKYVKDVCNNKLINNLNQFYQNLNAALDKVVAHNTAF